MATANSSRIVPGSPAQFQIVSPMLRPDVGSNSGQTADKTGLATPKTSDRIIESKTESEVAEMIAATTGSKNPANLDLLDLNSLKEKLFWRPVKFTKNRDYPKVVPNGFYFKQDSGGFALKRQESGKWYGHFTRKTVKELEGKYAKKKPRTRTSGSQGTAQRINRGGSYR
ncbi:MAG: hypothetical protein ACREBD_04150 [Blastocatellia bacterium]